MPHLFSCLILAHARPCSYLNLRPVEWIPDAPHALIDTRHRPSIQLLILLSIRVPQQFRFVSHSLVLQILHAYRPLGTVDVMCDDDRVFLWPWRDGELDLGVALRENGKRRLDEGVHAFRAAPPVAVVKVEAFALEDEGADAVLSILSFNSAHFKTQRL